MKSNSRLLAEQAMQPERQLIVSPRRDAARWRQYNRQHIMQAVYPLLSRSRFHLGVLALVALAVLWSHLTVYAPTLNPGSPNDAADAAPLVFTDGPNAPVASLSGAESLAEPAVPTPVSDVDAAQPISALTCPVTLAVQSSLSITVLDLDEIGWMPRVTPQIGGQMTETVAVLVTISNTQTLTGSATVAAAAPPTMTTLAFSSPLPPLMASDMTPANNPALPPIASYTVLPGDTILSIAAMVGRRPDTLIWSNKELEDDPDKLYVGQVLIILPLDGIYHTTGEGETVETIAQRYHASGSDIWQCPYNHLIADMYGVLIPNQKVVVPGGVKAFAPRYVNGYRGPIPDTAAHGTGNFIWPVKGVISQVSWDLHRAIDIAGDEGDIVAAADSGFVVYAAWDSAGYGNLVVIDHGNGFVTYYAHLYGFYVDIGQSVQRGDAIGARGDTGRSTGPHLHFEIRYQGELQDPQALLPMP